MRFRAPLANVRGHGSAREGTHHFWMQRLTAVALVPLTLWFVASLIQVGIDLCQFHVLLRGIEIGKHDLGGIDQIVLYFIGKGRVVHQRGRHVRCDALFTDQSVEGTVGDDVLILHPFAKGPDLFYSPGGAFLFRRYEQGT